MRNVLVALLFGTLLGCVTASSGNRPAPNAFDDERIEQEAISQINLRFNGSVRVSVTSFNRHALLTGEVPNESARAEIAQIVATVPNVRLVSNELAVGDTTGVTARSSDTLVTSNVKLRFLKNAKFPTDQVRVVADNGTVYLMGQLHRYEAASAADLASTTKGVRRVITVFEYIN